MKRFLQLFAPLAVAIALLVPFGIARAATTNYVALGDSYSSGVGTNRLIELSPAVSLGLISFHSSLRPEEIS